VIYREEENNEVQGKLGVQGIYISDIRMQREKCIRRERNNTSTGVNERI
jgi:hypothetical protein